MDPAPGPSEAGGTTRGTRNSASSTSKNIQVLYLFSGAQRKSSVTSRLVKLGEKRGINFQVHEIDIQNSPNWDLANKDVQRDLLHRVAAGEFDVVLVTPPCSTWSRVRGANCRGPPMIRSRSYPWGFPWLSMKHRKDADLGNVLIIFMLDVLEALEQHPVSSGGYIIAVFAEDPEDLGVAWREEDGMKVDPASIWQLDRLRTLVRSDSPLALYTVVFNQCCWGAPYRKPTRLLTNMLPLKSWGPCQWPQFDTHRNYLGPQVVACQCRTTVTLAKKPNDTGFRTSTTSVYPERMDRALAEAILTTCLTTPPSAKEGGQEKEWQVGDENPGALPAEQGEGHGLQPGQEGAGDQGVQDGQGRSSEKRAREEDQTEVKPGLAKAAKAHGGAGPPIQVSYKGERRALHDGAGLCSPGRWPVKRRRLPSSERASSTCSWFEEAFNSWLEKVGGETAKGIFWKMAAGKVQQSPFEEGMAEFRRSLDEHLGRWGLDPLRKKTDRSSEINFRRMRALAEALDDEDWEFLGTVASKGVELGVDIRMPRTPLVYEEKTRWTVDATDENAEDIARQVLQEVDRGTIIRMSEKEAKERYAGRLAVAALGAVPKELGTKKVRLIHDGTYSVDVNRRIRVLDKMRFPLIDDAAAILRQVQEEVDQNKGEIRFSVLYDIVRAHKLIPVVEDDWGLQAFRLPGDSSGDVFMHTRGTFGIASAAYWFGRAIAVGVRCAHRLLGRLHGVLHLIYADDGWITAVGKDFWQRILMWFFIFELLEVPVTWAKVRGGTQVDWIGYCLNVHDYQKGINSSKRGWIVGWIETKTAQGGVVGRELKSVLGRLSFVAGALRHVRPFLAPLFSWASTMAPGTFSNFPDAVLILLEFIKEEVTRRPMRPAEPLEKDPIDIFRVDAKAAGEEIVIGGWETGANPDQLRARWFSFSLNRKNAPWAYLKGDPFRNIASLELIGVLVAVMVFAPGSTWVRGGAAVTLTAYTDNLANTHVLKKFGSSRYPLSIIAMELAVQLDMAGIDLQLQWVPRGQNQPADDLTNSRFDDFDSKNRMSVVFEDMPFKVMGKLLEKAGDLDTELKLFRTSKEAKAAQQSSSLATGKKAKKGELRWRDPW